MSEFAENREGVHLVVNEHTLCGDALDIDSEPDDDHDGALQITKKQAVTCKRCIAIIELCRNVKIRLK